MNVIVTCGPSYEPIDEVRRITNFSTGRLGITLANVFSEARHKVFCLKGEQATDPTSVRGSMIPFSTNDDLTEKLRKLSSENIGVIFHAAALCDFKVGSVENSAGEQIVSKKFPTRGDSLTLNLVPTTKVLPRLREWFPNAQIVSWKYEVAGTREEAIEKALRQIQEARTNACVLNGVAYGTGFCFCESDRKTELATLADLCTFLLSRFGKAG